MECHVSSIKVYWGIAFSRLFTAMITSTHIYHHISYAGLPSISLAKEWRTLDKSAVHHRTDIKKQTRTLKFTSTDNYRQFDKE